MSSKKVKLTAEEVSLLVTVFGSHEYEKLMKSGRIKRDCTLQPYKENSGKEFDLHIDGDDFFAWLPLAYLHKFGLYTCDWSIIRDSSEEAVYDMLAASRANPKQNIQFYSDADFTVIHKLDS